MQREQYGKLRGTLQCSSFWYFLVLEKESVINEESKLGGLHTPVLTLLEKFNCRSQIICKTPLSWKKRSMAHSYYPVGLVQ